MSAVASLFALFGVIMIGFSVVVGLVEHYARMRTIAPAIFMWVGVASIVVAIVATMNGM